MRSFAAGFLGQLARLVRERKMRVFLALFLLACAACLATYHQKVVEDVPVAVLDLDNSRLSRTLRTYLESTPELALVDAPGSLDEARERLVQGSLAAVVLVPADFSSELKHGRRGQVLVGIDMSNILVGKTAYKALFRALNTVAGGVELVFLQKSGVPGDQAMARVLPVRVDETLAFNPTSSYAVYVTPPLLYFFLHIVVLILAGSVFLGADAPSDGPGLAGRYLAILLVGVGAGLLLTYGYLRVEDLLPQSGFAWVLACLAALCAVDLLMAGALFAVIPSPTLAFQASLLVGMLSLMLSGATFPVDAFPALFRRLAELVPFTPFVRLFRLFLTSPAGGAELGEPLRQLAKQGGLFAAIAAAGLLARAAVAGLAQRRSA